MAEKAEKTKQGHKMQLYTTKVFTPQDLLTAYSVHVKQFCLQNLFDNCDCQNLVL